MLRAKAIVIMFYPENFVRLELAFFLTKLPITFYSTKGQLVIKGRQSYNLMIGRLFFTMLRLKLCICLCKHALFSIKTQAVLNKQTN